MCITVNMVDNDVSVIEVDSPDGVVEIVDK